ncbi:MAG: hypothetical protein P8M68_04530 [Aquiluna sp.]|nr:hypothetical protein [Aquiluna sp.]
MKFGLRAVLSTFILAASVVVPVTSASANGCGVNSGGPFDGGDGSSGSPFLVSTATQLASMETNACLTNSYHFKQTADISLAGLSWTPLGTAFEFNGTYDGNFKTITDLSLTGGTNVGLFGTINGATIKNLRLVDASVSGSGFAGAVAAFTKAGSTLDKLMIVNASVTSTGNNAGGATGMTQGARSYLSKISVDASVSAAGNAGGVVGQVEFVSGTVSDVSFTGSVTSTGQMSGGIVGYGIAQTIENAYSLGTITGGTVYRGGVLARDGNGAGVVTNSFFLGSGVTQLSSNYATAKTTLELADISTFTSWSMTDDRAAVIDGSATETWISHSAVNSGYPVLVWQVDAGFVTVPAPAVVTPAPYAGPLVVNLAREVVKSSGGQRLTLKGYRLNLITGLSVDGIQLNIESLETGELTAVLPVLSAGLKDLVIVSSQGQLTHQDALLVVAAPEATTSAAKVNAGSFKGYVAVYAKGYEGSRLSAKVGNGWIVVPALASDFERVVQFTGAGVDVAVRIYIDRVLVDTINLTTK